jgi:hypothetical protein
MLFARMKKALALLSIALACAGCSAPKASSFAGAPHPGWGRRDSSAEERMSVRAVPAAASPSVPITRLAKPGWGRD